MPEREPVPACENPVWPCAMTGAADCLSGLQGLEVVIHGSSGCYYYPASLLRASLNGTFLVEEEIVFGAEERLREVVSGLAGENRRVAVVTTCVPSLTGEDTARILEEFDAIFVDSPGFLGPYETGYALALSRLGIRTDPETRGVNIDGLSRFDPFATGNLIEISRLLAAAGTPVGSRLCRGTYASVSRTSAFTIESNPDLRSGAGECLGTMLGIDQVRATSRRLEAKGLSCDISPVIAEADAAEERVVRACDRYLRRHDPPVAAIFSWFPYARFAADALARYLDAGIAIIGSRTGVRPSPYRSVHTIDHNLIGNLITGGEPDLLIGSSFEHSFSPETAFVPLTPPVRGRVLLRSTPVAGIEGTLAFMESVLNACMDKKDLFARS
ncbi:MAG: nitrogenase component 1 [Methanoregulaceae archaeon]|nr:nitrogenase component 1 [Methanoregulaceae archaeon]